MSFFDCLVKKAQQDRIERLVVGAIITNELQHVLLVKRMPGFMGGILEIPGGKIEPGETISDALTREVKEETNLNIVSVYSFIDFFDYPSNSNEKSRHLNFHVNAVTDSRIILTEHDDYLWDDLANLENRNEITDELKYTLMLFKFNYIR